MSPEAAPAHAETIPSLAAALLATGREAVRARIDLVLLEGSVAARSALRVLVLAFATAVIATTLWLLAQVFCVIALVELAAVPPLAAVLGVIALNVAVLVVTAYAVRRRLDRVRMPLSRSLLSGGTRDESV